ncbi:hypothetical protein CANINC_001949 [Pichia inconspicua]|uniref:Iron-sulfur assembly protein 1 n=1 Tax=Pichia inconspicua TaxID=52247 RepID=A0A4T0X2H3_9ASCO|nr:hypothetical protein CANINC_001949 [[Candida] inconspicua]
MINRLNYTATLRFSPSIRLLNTSAQSIVRNNTLNFSNNNNNTISQSEQPVQPKRWSRHVIGNSTTPTPTPTPTPSPISTTPTTTPTPLANTTTTTTTSTTPPTTKKRKRRTLKPLRAPITLTETAKSHLRALSKGPNPKLIRISVRNRGCSGLTYHLEYVDKPEKFDEIVQDGDIKVVIDSKALFSIIGSEMDWIDNKLSSKFVFKNPNSKGTCGCGESFMV